MRVQRVLSASDTLSWAVLDQSGIVDPIDVFLSHLTAVERSPNTVRAYAYDLMDYFRFARERDLDWRAARLDDVGSFVGWLRAPRELRGRGVAALPSVAPALAASSINRKLSALAAFYEFHQRCGTVSTDPMAPGGGSRRRGGSWKPFLAHLGDQKVKSRVVKLPAARPVAQDLTEQQVRTLIGRCDRIRDRFLLSLLRGSGLRIGEVLGLRHEDFDPSRREVAVRQRFNVNGARAKSWSREVPVAGELIEMYSDYLHIEYGDLDSDYVFVNVWGEPRGHPLKYSAVYGLVRRLRAQTGIEFGLHSFRHTYATDLLRRGTPIEVVSKLLGHASVATTADIYAHLTVEDSRRALVTAGFLHTDREES